MQTTDPSFNGNRILAFSGSFLLIVSPLLLMLFYFSGRENKTTWKSIPMNARADFSAVVNTMRKATYGSARLLAPGNPVQDKAADQLRQSDWFSTVRADLEKRSYAVAADRDPQSFKTVNIAQQLSAQFSSSRFVLAPLAMDAGKAADKNRWQLPIAVKGIYADHQLFGRPEEVAVAVDKNNNELSYRFGSGFEIQYHNDAKGVRQNFVISQKPAGNVHAIRVQLQAGGDWVVNQVHDQELHFARKNAQGGLDNKIVYNDLKVWDARGKALAARMELKADNGFEIVASVDNAVYPVTIDPLSSSSSPTLSGAAAGTYFGSAIAGAGDVNGDGYSDVVVGAPATSLSAGAAFIYLGSASGLSSSPAATLNGLGAGNEFGTSVATAGDVNGDGYADVVIGAPGVNTGRGAAYIFLGSGSGIANNAAASAILNGAASNDSFGISVAHAGDVNKDTYSDIVIGAYKAGGTGAAYIFTGSNTGIPSGASPAATLTGISAGDGFGFSVAGAGDVNADGYSDVVIGAPGVSTGTGAAYIFNGSSSGIITGASPSATLNGISAGDGFGFSVSSAGDVNGDGYSDVIAGAPGVTTNTGAAYIFTGSITGTATSPATTLGGTSSGDHYGFSVAGAGDMNGDAFSDVIVGAYGVSSSAGAAYVYEGTSTGIANAATAALSLAGSTGGDKYGAAVASAGDVNGDGISDVLAAAPNATGATGNVYTYRGNADASASAHTLVILGQSTGDRYGISVSTAGDINGDGYSDVVVGAIGYNAGALNGAAYLYFGSSTGLSTSPSILSIPSGTPESGWSVAAGDINGDGYSDLAVGAKFGSTLGANSNNGSVYIYYGSSTGISNAASPTTINGGGSGYFSGSAVAVADINGDGYADLAIGAPGVNTLRGAVFIYNGSAGFATTQTLSATLNGSNAYDQFGYSLSAAGDVNGDGYVDLVVGAPASYNYPTSANNLGYANVYIGAKAGIANNATANYVLSDATAGIVDFGINVAGAGDVNGDGFADLVIGASSADNNSNPGTAEIFLGSSSGVANPAATVLHAPGSAAEDQFGASVASAGDVNGDGYSDVIIRATKPLTGNGATYIYTGSTTGISSSPAITFSDAQSNTGQELGSSSSVNGVVAHSAVAGAGDVNGDGYSDVIIGVYTDATVGTKSGLSYIYYGNNAVGHNASNKLELYNTDLSTPIAASNLSQSQFGLGLYAQSPFGAVKGRLVWETEPNGIPFLGSPITNSVFSTAQGSYALIPAGGTEFKNLVNKTTAKSTKVRARIQYASTAVTFGQRFSPWVYSQTYLLGMDPGILPLDLLSFTASNAGQDILLNWKASDETGLSAYVVQHSLDGAVFDSIGIVTAKGTTGISSYDFTHYHPIAGMHYYRLKELNKDGSISYSMIVSAKINGPGVEFNIYPNPATDHIIVTHTGIKASYLRIMSASGALMGLYPISNNADQTTISLSGYAKGNYFVEILNSGFAPRQITVQ